MLESLTVGHAYYSWARYLAGWALRAFLALEAIRAVRGQREKQPLHSRVGEWTSFPIWHVSKSS